MKVSAGVIVLLTLSIVGTIAAQEPGERFYSQQDPGSRGQVHALCAQELPAAEAALYEAIAPLSIQDQRKILFNVTPEVKSRLWVYNVCGFAQRHDGTAQQRKALHSYVRYVAEPYVFTLEPMPLQFVLKQQTLAALRAQIDAASFSVEDQATAFYHLGPTAPPRLSLLSVPADDGDPSAQSGMPPCICRSNVDCWGYYALFCHSDAGGLCMPVWMCGMSGTEACDGVC